jgi:fructose-1,6-bisphosphatase I
MYEANPMAGWSSRPAAPPPMAASASWTSSPTKLHERVSVILGSKNEVERVTSYHNTL